MATRQGNAVLQHLRRAILLDGGVGLTDGQLLGCFIDQRDDAAFAALVRRHGPMVLSVCRRMVGNAHDADDAFQATFLVLIRKASSIKPRELVGNWLYGVAYHTALKARALATRRQAREKQVTAMPEPEAAVPQNANLDLQLLLDQELSRMPDEYRVPIVLCDLEGKSRKEAARQLGWLDGTLSGRLARARQMLAKRLTSRGLAVSAGVVAVVLSQTAAPASVPASLLMSTVKDVSVFAAGSAAGALSSHAVTLAEGVLKTMLFAKLKAVGIVFLLVAVAGVGLGFSTAGRSRAQDKPLPGVAQKDKSEPSKGKVTPPKDDRRDDKADEDIKAKQLAVQLADLKARIETLQRELALTQKERNDQLASRDNEVQRLKDENALLKRKLEKIQEDQAEHARRQQDQALAAAAQAEKALKEKERLEKVSVQAEKDLRMAEKYLTSGHREAAAFYYELVIRRYPETSYAKEAAKRRDELFEKFEREQDGAATIPQLKEENERLKQLYEKARKEADELKDQIEQLRKFLDKKPPEDEKE